MLNPNDDVIIDENEPTDDVTVEQDANESGDSSAPNQDVDNEVDDKGVSYKNRFFEVNRKFENLQKSIPQMIQEAAEAAAKNTSAAQPRQQEYSVQDYINAKVKDPANAPYYDAKILELQEQKVSQTVKTELTNFQRQQQERAVQQQAEAWAYNNFPQLRDPSNPLTQLANQYYQARPADKRLPEDFAVAVELAANRLGVKPTMINKPQDQVNQLNRKVKAMTKERTLEGDGRGRTEINKVSDRERARQEALKTGDLKSYIQNYLLKPREDA